MKEAIFHPSADARLRAPALTAVPALTAALAAGTGGTVGKPGLENSPAAAVPAGFSGTLDAGCGLLPVPHIKHKGCHCCCVFLGDEDVLINQRMSLKSAARAE